MYKYKDLISNYKVSYFTISIIKLGWINAIENLDAENNIYIHKKLTMVKRPIPYSTFCYSVLLKIVKFFKKIKKKIHRIRQNHSILRVHGIRQLGMVFFCIKINFKWLKILSILSFTNLLILKIFFMSLNVRDFK